MRKHHTRLSADGGKGTNSATEQLIPPPGSGNLKVKSLIELSEFFWEETDADDGFAIRRYHPPTENKKSW